MKFFYVLIIFFLSQSCSFDNKTGIWKNDNIISQENDNLFKEFKTLSNVNKFFDEEVYIDEKFRFPLLKVVNNLQWKDVFYNENNNLKNFKYNGLNQQIFKSKKLSKNKVNNFILYEDNHLIISDSKGNLIVFSISKNKIITKFNFYKKRYKKMEKKLNLIIEDKIIYVSDNIGYLYAFDIRKNQIIWAKNHKIPFRSNLKLSANKLIASNQNNNLFFFDKKNGDILKLIPTEETILKNKFINNLSRNDNSIFFLNTYGSLYSVNIESMRINWFINLNQSLDLDFSNLFLSNQVVNNGKGKIVISSNYYTYIINSKNGSILYKKNLSSKFRPIIVNDFLFLITKKNLLVSINLITGEIVYSYDINRKIAEFINTKKQTVQIKNIMLANNNILITLKNSYILKFNINGNLDNINNLPSKINSEPIIINGSILYLNHQNKLLIVD
jgi:outer membrane protein assembly factor BamB